VNFDRLLVVLRRRWIVVAGVLAVALLVAAGVTALQTTKYEATSTVRMVTRASDLTTGIGVDAIQYEDRVANTYREILETRGTRDWLAARLGVGSAPGVDVALPANSQLVKITASDTSARRAAQAANLLASRLATTIAVPGTVQLVEPARTPGSPATPSWPLNLGLAALAGLLGGAALALVLERRDTRLRRVSDIEDVARAPVIAEIPAGATGPPAIVNSGSPQEEAFRGLMTTIAATERDGPLQVILFTGLESGHAAVTVMANLAAGFARAGRKVVAVDADMREPALHAMFRLTNSAGLSQVLRGTRAASSVIRETRHPGLDVLPAGRNALNPGEALSSLEMTELLNGLRVEYESVLLCAHSLLDVSDARVIASAVDGVVLIVHRHGAHEDALRRAVRELDLLDARLIGLVVVDGPLAGRGPRGGRLRARGDAERRAR